jgi:protein TonB
MAWAADVDDLQMTGIASYTELRQPYYIGALYLDQPLVSAGQVLSSWGQRRMEIRITAERWTPRRFSSQWTQALILNVDAVKLEKFADAFLQFNNLPRNGFRRGDHIVLESDKKGRTRVSVNGTEMFIESKPGFFEILLATWLGDKPPSTEFKLAVMGQIDSTLLVEYDALQPGPDRVAAVATWLSGGAIGEELESGATVTELELAASDSEPPADSAGQKEDSAAAAAVAAATAVAAAAPKAAASTAAVNREVAAIADAVSVSDAVTKPVVANPDKSTAAKPSRVVAMAPAVKDIASERENLQLDPEIYRLQQNILLKLYRSSIIKRALRQVKYPKSAVRRGQQGTVVLELTVNRSGEVLSLDQSSTTRYKSLNAAALAAVEDAGVLPPVPAGLEGEQVVVSIPVKFALR